jgi:hypothetical protein
MSDDEFQFFRDQVENILREDGRPIEWDDEQGLSLVSPDGTRLVAALGRIASVYAGTSHHEREPLLRCHFEVALRPPEPPSSFAEAADRLRIGLRATSYFAADSWSVVTRPVADDLIAILYLNAGTAIATVSDDDLRAWGEPPDAIWRRALDNVHAEPTVQERTDTIEGGGTVRAIVGWESFGAARSLELERYIDVIGKQGAIVAVPTIDTFMAHAIGSDGELAATLRWMAVVAAEMFNDEEDPLSPHLYWRRGHAWTRITATGDDGVQNWDAPPELKALLGRRLA